MSANSQGRHRHRDRQQDQQGKTSKVARVIPEVDRVVVGA